MRNCCTERCLTKGTARPGRATPRRERKEPAMRRSLSEVSAIKWRVKNYAAQMRHFGKLVTWYSREEDLR